MNIINFSNSANLLYYNMHNNKNSSMAKYKYQTGVDEVSFSARKKEQDADKEKIITTEKLMNDYDVSAQVIENAIKNGMLIPVGGKELQESDDINELTFDVEDKSNKKAIAYFKTLERKKKIKAEKRALADAIARNKQDKGVFFKQEYTTGELETMGYGSKADLMANCGIRTNDYEIKKYILNSDSFDVLHPTIRGILTRSLDNNPAIIGLKSLKSYLGENFIDAVNNMNIISVQVTIPENGEEYLVDVSDEKNYEYLKTIDNPDLQKVLDEKIQKYKEYKAENIRQMEDFLKIKNPPSRLQREREIRIKYGI